MRESHFKEGVTSCLMLLTKAFFILMTAIAVLLVCCGCTATRSVNSDTAHLVREMTARMDSIVASRMVIRQDSSFRESILRQLQRITEKSDTSRFVVVDTAGNTVRERIVINNVREVTSETERLEREVIMHRLEKIDSALTLVQRQMLHTDSLVANRDTFVEVPAKLSWWQRLRLWLGNAALVLMVVVVGYGALRLWAAYRIGKL